MHSIKGFSIDNRKYGELLKNTLIFGLGLVGTKFVQFILLPYFTNVLTTAEYGVIDLVISFSGLAVPIVTLELSDAVLRFGLSEDIDKRELLQNTLCVLLFGSVAAIGVSPLLLFYPTIYNWRWFVVSIIITQGIRTNFALFVKADNRILTYSIDSIMTAIIIAVFDIFLISYLKYGIKGYFISEIIGNVFSIFFLFVFGQIKKYFVVKRKINKNLLKEMMRYSIPLMFNAISWWITSFSDRMVLDWFFSPSEVGIYSVSAKIPAIVTTLLSVFTQAWIMSAVKNYEKEKDVKFFENIFSVYSTLLFILVSFIIIVIKPIMRIYVGHNFFASWYYVPLLLVGSAFLGISNYYGAIYAAAKANLLEIKSTIICAVTNVILNILLIPYFSILGAVIATMLSYIVVVIVRIIDSKKILLVKNSKLFLMINFIVLILESALIMDDNYILAGISVLFLLAFNMYIFMKKVKI